ncbi:MAG: DNA-directed RNA polymerase subunit D [Candidatus Nanoarchaeia archaeon]|jgi:DNA-directed RNA polymerase subunit D
MSTIKFLKSADPNTLKFILSDSYVEFANALRRALISEVPVMAINKINYQINNSAIYNEVLALRFGLIPLVSDAKSYVTIDKCSCKGKGCAKCTARLTLDVKGPGIVYARDLKPVDPKIKPVEPDMPIVKLFEGQSVRLEAEAVLGYGVKHATFNACMATYQYYPKITANCSCKAAVDACPKGVLDYTAKKVVVKDLEACDLCNACVDACTDKGLKVEGRDDKFLFTIESWGQYEPKELLKLAVNELLLRTKEFEDGINK